MFKRAMFARYGDEYIPLRISEDGQLIIASQAYVWNTDSLSWVKATGSLIGANNVSINNFPSDYAKDATLVGGNIAVKLKELAPTDTLKNNGSTVLLYDGDGNLQYIDETIKGVTYRTTLSYTGGKLSGISQAVAQ